jgi:Cu(I)/Ag(I) efflux system membrane protein CusA/SilA
MLVYLGQAHERRAADGRLNDREDLFDAVREGAGQRLRPVLMTATAVIFGLLPILWGSGTGASVMKRIAAPMVGGMVSATLLTLVVIPAIYSLWQEFALGRVRAGGATPVRTAPVPDLAGVIAD